MKAPVGDTCDRISEFQKGMFCGVDNSGRIWKDRLVFILLRGIIVNRTYGTHKNLYISVFLLTIFGPIYYGPP